MTQLSFSFRPSFVVTMPDGDEIELTPAQASVIDRARFSDPRRDSACDGCAVHGLCVWHSRDAET